jgi:trigger factor
MNITVETQPNCRAILHFIIPSEDVTRERDRVLSNYARQARLPGFRPGKAPKNVVAKKFEKELQGDLQDALVRLGYQEAAKRDDVEILNVVGVKDSSLHTDDSFTFALEVTTTPHFELPEYKGIPVKLPRIEVTEEDIDHDLLHLRERYKSFNDVDREAQLGDFVVIEATGSLDGQPIADLYADAPAFIKKIDGNWFELTADESFMPGFFAALVGIKKDETRDVTVTLAEDFSHEGLKGKTIVMHVVCKFVKESQMPELNDELAKKIKAEWDVAALREQVRKGITQRREQSREDAKTQQVIAHLAERLEFEMPQDMINREAQRRTNDIAMNAMRQGMEQDAIMGVQEQIVAAATQQARQNVKVSFILGEVAKREKIKATEEQVRMALAQMAARERISPKKLMAEANKTNLIERLQDDILLDNALQFLKQNATIEETEPVKDDCGHNHG